MNRNLPEAKEGIESKRQSGIDHGVYGAKYIYDLSGKYGPNGRIVGELLANVIAIIMEDFLMQKILMETAHC